MTYSVLNGDIMVRKGIFWTIGEHMYFYFPIISYQRIKIYRVEITDIGIFCCNNGFSRKFNPGKNCGVNVRDRNPLVVVIRC